MKKGLTMTLLTVALAMLSYQAMAIAPVISNIPSPVVGSGENMTAPHRFVYPDAINLDEWVSDEDNADDTLKWSYEIVGTPKYKINGVDPINSSDASTVRLNPGSKEIRGQVLNGEQNPDSKTNTITIRNVELSPLSGTGDIDPTETGLLDGKNGKRDETQLVTLYASDGTTYAQKEVVFYTDNGARDKLSMGGETVNKITFNNATQDNWTNIDKASEMGTVTYSTRTNTGVCMEVPKAGNNIGGWMSPYGMIKLAKNGVYDIRLKMWGSQVGGEVPFWTVSLDNYGDHGYNLYGAELFVMDNEGSANAVTNAGKTIHFFWTPAAVATDQWNGTGAFSDTTKYDNPFNENNTANKDNRDARLIFRVFDAELVPALTADKDFGSLCIDEIEVVKYDLSTMRKVRSTGMNRNADFVLTSDSDLTVGNIDFASAVAGSTNVTVDSSGVISVIPTALGQGLLYDQVNPGNKQNDFNNPSTQADNYPTAWKADTLYQVKMQLSAPSTAAEANPFSVFWLGADTPTNELIYKSFVTNKLGGCAMPKAGTPQTYMAFYHGNGGTNGRDEWKFLRPTMVIGNLEAFKMGNNGGGMKIHSWVVDEVSFQ